MRDYYRNFVTKNSRNTQIIEPTKPTKAPSARFVGSLTNEFSEKTTEAYLAILQEFDEEQLIIFEERIAIMVYDGGLSEAEAIHYLIANRVRTPNFNESGSADIPLVECITKNNFT